jgi:hypothetical protein
MPRRTLIKTYDVVFQKDLLVLSQFRLKGAGRFFINEEEGIVEMNTEESNSALETMPGKAADRLPLFGWVFKLILDYELAGVDIISFPKAEIREIARFESTISFLAPTTFGSTKFKRVRFSASSLVAAQEIEEVLKAQPVGSKPALKAHPYRLNESLNKTMLLKTMATATAIAVLFLLCLLITYFAWTALGYYAIAFFLAGLFVFVLWRVFRNKSKDITSVKINSK